MRVSSNIYVPRATLPRRAAPVSDDRSGRRVFPDRVLATQLIEILFTIFAGILLAVLLAGVSQELNEDVYVPRPLALLLTTVGLAGLLVGLWKLAGPDISE